jgi:two-component system NtrC family sensor kinase
MEKDPPTVELFASMLLSEDTRQVLARHGVRAHVELSDEAGQPVSGAVRQALMTDLAIVLQRSEHMRRLATVGSLAAGVTHEARNLLTGVVGFAQVLLSKSSAGETQDMLRSIETEARRCVDMLASYLKLSRSGVEAVRLLSAGEIVRPIECLVAYQLRQRQCSLSVSVVDSLPRVLGSASELQRVLINLVLNAADASGKGGHIFVQATSEDGQWLDISVTDDGPGVPVELRERIFEPFFSTKAAGEGTGLGLALSRRIAESHRGELVLEASSRPGTTFSLRLPVASELAGKR